MKRYRCIDGTCKVQDRQAKASASAMEQQANRACPPLGSLVACAMCGAILHNVLIGHRVGLRAAGILSGL